MVEKPRSIAILRKLLNREVKNLPPNARQVYMRGFENAVLAQFLPTDAAIKGGGAISLRYPLAEARKSRNLDATFADSAEAFEQSFRTNLRQGWEGFAGDLEPQERSTGINPATQMRPYTVHLTYLDKPFHTYTLEAAPDHSGFLAEMDQALSPDARDMLESFGFAPKSPNMVSLINQLADKLHAVCDEAIEPRRGRDLFDINLLSKEIDRLGGLEPLRSACRNVEAHEHKHPHVVHRIPDSDMGLYRPSFDSLIRAHDSITFHQCWDLTARLLEQVDIRYQASWVGLWREAKPEEFSAT